MKTTLVYTCLMVLLIATIGCGKLMEITGLKKSVVYLNVHDKNDKPITDADVKVTANGKEVPLKPTGTSEEKFVKVKKGKSLVVNVEKDGFRQETQEYTVEKEIEHIKIKLNLLPPYFKLATTLSNPKVVAGADKKCDVKITLANEGEGDAFDVEVRGNIPEGLQYVQPTGSPKEVDGSLVWRLEQLGAGKKYRVSYSLMPMPDAKTGDTVVNIEASGSDIISEKIDYEDKKILNVTGQAIINKEDGDFQYEVTPGDLRLNEEDKVEYTIRVRNSGGGETTEITLSLSFPEGFTLDENSLTLDEMGLPSQVRIIRKEKWSYSVELLPPLRPGNNYELKYAVKVSKDTKKGSKTSTATLTTKDEADGKIKVDDAATVKIIETPQPAVLTVTKSMTDESENTLECTLLIKNDGNGSARKGEITDKLPDGFSLIQPSYLKENNPSEYKVIAKEGGKTQYEAGLLKLNAEHPSALVWLIEKLRANSEIEIQYDIKTEDAKNIIALRELKEKNEKKLPGVTVTALNEWDRTITASAKATYSPKTGVHMGGKRTIIPPQPGVKYRRPK